MSHGRREFILKSAFLGAGLTLGQGALLAAEAEGKKAALKISSQDGIIPGKGLRDKVVLMEKWGFDGLEVWGGGLPGRVKEIEEALKGTKIKLSAICAGYDGVLCSEDAESRKKTIQSMQEILAAAGALGSTGLIVVPAFNGQSKLSHPDMRKVLVDVLPELGEAAQKAGTRVLLEPLNRGEAYFLRQLADAAAICRDAKHPAVCLMGDFYHMGIEEPSDLGAFLSAGPYLHHVHLASRKRNLPGQDERSYVNGFIGLKILGYDDYASLECGVVGERETEIPKAVQFLRRQWDEADPASLLKG